MRSLGRPNSQCASITSRPLFIIVAESTEILRPITQFGCLHASSGVTLASVTGSRVRNGPPDAVTMIFAIPPCSAASRGMHWKIALCSLSTGNRIAP